MSAPSTGLDFQATLRLMGLPVAGSILQTAAANATQSFMDSLDEKYNALEAMEQFANTWVTIVVGEEMLGELPEFLDFVQLQTIVAAAWKKVQPSEREKTLSTVATATIAALQAKRKLLESLARRSESRTSASPAPTRLSVLPSSGEPATRLSVLPSAVDSAPPMTQPMTQPGMVQSTVQVALQPTVLPSGERGPPSGVVAVRTHHPRCPRCNKRETKCLCSSLHALPLAPRGEVEGSLFLARTAPTQVPRHTGQIQRINAQHKDGLVNDPSAVPRIRAHNVGRGVGSRTSVHQSSSSDSDDSSSQPRSDPSQSGGIVPADTSFANPAMLYMPKFWMYAFQSGQTDGDLRRELLLQFGISKLRISHPGDWKLDLAEELVEVLVLMSWSATDEQCMDRIIHILFRIRLFQEGAPAADIDKAMSKLRGYKLPKHFRSAAASIKKQLPSGSTSRKSPVSTARLPKEQWNKMDAKQQAAHKKKHGL